MTHCNNGVKLSVKLLAIFLLQQRDAVAPKNAAPPPVPKKKGAFKRNNFAGCSMTGKNNIVNIHLNSSSLM